uniref:(California timema) hypothetical protein n=1 Tax=Timema californicum TaxID=61474 RepID=A0A7R9PD89_TIMCA|nr:unnamed protein product [Timema californicum]
MLAPAWVCPPASHSQLTQSLRRDRTDGRTTALSSKTITLLHLTSGQCTWPRGWRSRDVVVSAPGYEARGPVV